MKLSVGLHGAAKLRQESVGGQSCCQNLSHFVSVTKCAGVAYTRGSPFALLLTTFSSRFKFELNLT